MSIFERGLGDDVPGNIDWRPVCYQHKWTGQTRLSLNNLIQPFLIGLPADDIRNINGKKITMLQKSVDVIQIDMIRIHKIGVLPAKFGYGLVSGLALILWGGSDNLVLTKRLVPYRFDVHAQINGFLYRR